MGHSLASLADVFPDQQLECAVAGCRSLCLGASRQNESDHAPVDSALPSPVCDDCRRQFAELAELTMPCARQGCEGSWQWMRLQQLIDRRQAEASGREPAANPSGLCPECQRQAEELGDRDVECMVKGCSETWRWTGVERLCQESQAPPPRMCARCTKRLARLQDRDIRCCLDGCEQTWCWTAREQFDEMIQMERSTTPPPPRRMCGSCQAKFRLMHDRDIPCRVTGCQRTWQLTAEAQLRHQLIHGENSDPAEGSRRMCNECHAFLKQARPRQIPCRIRACKNTWTYTPSWQLNDFARGRTRPPSRLCESCQKRLQELQLSPQACMVPGCQNTWDWTPEEQLREMVLAAATNKPLRPPKKRCVECDEFLRRQPGKKLYCNDCGSEISWSSYEQLLHSRGTFAKPTRCSDCAARIVAEKKPVPEDFIVHSDKPKFQVPSRGPWQKHQTIAHSPPGMDRQTIERLQAADFRVIAFGDDMTVAAPGGEQCWPLLLQQELNTRLRDAAATVAVANAGIEACDSGLARLRIARDVQPFQPHLVIVSFVFADARVEVEPGQNDTRGNHRDDHQDLSPEQLLLRQLRTLHSNLLYWLPNPIFPQQQVKTEMDTKTRQWVNSLDNRYRQQRARVGRLCQAKGVALLDVGSKFEVNGLSSASKWMKDPYHPNQAGHRNIAKWMAGAILQQQLLPVETGEG